MDDLPPKMAQPFCRIWRQSQSLSEQPRPVLARRRESAEPFPEAMNPVRGESVRVVSYRNERANLNNASLHLSGRFHQCPPCCITVAARQEKRAHSRSVETKQ